MELQLTNDQQLLAETTRRFLDDSCPLTEVRRLADTPAGFEPAWWRQGAELGWTSLLVPEARGGGSVSGQGLNDLALVAEEMGRTVAPGPLVPVNVVAATLAASAADEAGPVLDGLLAGTGIAAWCPPGPDGGPEARPAGPGRFTVHGGTGPVEAGAEADHLLVSARTPDGPAQLLVAAEAPGVTVARRGSLDLVRRFATVTFDGAPAIAVAAPGATGADGQRQLELAAVLSMAETVGAITRVFEFTLEWAFDRTSFGRPLASYQALKHRFADMRLWLEASAATVAAATRAVQAESPEAAELVSVAKSYVGSRAPELVQDCVQMHGGIGVTWDHAIHLYLRRVTVNAQTYGTVGQHRRRLAAVCGLGAASEGSAR